MTASGPIRAAIVGSEVGPFTQPIDARWLMAYAAGLGETDARYYDTLGSHGPAAHPLFPVCYEWPVALEIRAKTIADELAPLSVHATHHVVIHRAPRAGDRLLTSARVIAIGRRRRGTLVVTRFTTVDERGAPVTTTDYGSVYRGVTCDQEATLTSPDVGAWTTRRAHREASDPDPSRGPAPPGRVRANGGLGAMSGPPAQWTETIDVPAWAAHVYTECARIWNPIHTDVQVATTAGLATIILHGTATLALAISRVVTRDLRGDPARVREISARFTGMVPMPSTLAVRGGRSDDAHVHFDAIAAAGALVLSDGILRHDP